MYFSQLQHLSKPQHNGQMLPQYGQHVQNPNQRSPNAAFLHQHSPNAAFLHQHQPTHQHQRTNANLISPQSVPVNSDLSPTSEPSNSPLAIARREQTYIQAGNKSEAMCMLSQLSTEALESNSKDEEANAKVGKKRGHPEGSSQNNTPKRSAANDKFDAASVLAQFSSQ